MVSAQIAHVVFLVNTLLLPAPLSIQNDGVKVRFPPADYLGNHGLDSYLKGEPLSI